MHLTFELQQFLCVMLDRGWEGTLRFKWQLELFGKIEWSEVYLLCSLTVDDKIVHTVGKNERDMYQLLYSFLNVFEITLPLLKV